MFSYLDNFIRIHPESSNIDSITKTGEDSIEIVISGLKYICMNGIIQEIPMSGNYKIHIIFTVKNIKGDDNYKSCSIQIYSPNSTTISNYYTSVSGYIIIRHVYNLNWLDIKTIGGCY